MEIITNLFASKNIRNVLMTFVLILNTHFSFSQSVSCNTSLTVENNGNIRSTPIDGTYYSMILTNGGSSTDTYTLSFRNINNSCVNTDGSSTVSNVAINTSFINSEKNPISEITLGAGQTVNFYVHITVPTGTNVGKWSCNQIIATSKNCTNYSADAVLHTFLINPVND